MQTESQIKLWIFATIPSTISFLDSLQLQPWRIQKSTLKRNECSPCETEMFSINAELCLFNYLLFRVTHACPIRSLFFPCAHILVVFNSLFSSHVLRATEKNLEQALLICIFPSSPLASFFVFARSIRQIKTRGNGRIVPRGEIVRAQMQIN